MKRTIALLAACFALSACNAVVPVMDPGRHDDSTVQRTICALPPNMRPGHHCP